ncbi:dephospho-CoA kinase [Paenibacillus turpanensis]|uniref:dephospho-CoA kinase n=1 Tax=Paenibacillus turpanensis TaxID=2689078 RepID=UPI0014072337|nr:dephospho-CoA kinase [Paenibacillus turpanensis]
MNIGLTGGIACGKSTVADIFVRLGAVLVDADQIAREVVLPGRPALRQIAERFGQAVLKEDGTLNRKRLGELIFGNVDARKDLEAIIHPPIRAEITERIAYWSANGEGKTIVFDIPLLFESKYEGLLPDTVVVYIPRELQLKRLMARDGINESEAEQRLLAQMPIEEKRKLAAHVIDNSGSMQETESQVINYLQKKGLL